MARFKSSYVCQQCGASQVGWSGKCPQCGEWNTLVETVTQTGSSASSKDRFGKKVMPAEKIKLSSVKKTQLGRSRTKIDELDRVLGGGIVPGQVILIAGEPGIGKSTILIQLVEKLGESIYVSGEESARQVKIRADRLGVKTTKIDFVESTNIDAIIELVEKLDSKDLPGVIIIDSIQTMYTSDLSGMAGSVGQVREVSARLVKLAKSKHIPIFIVGHVTKQGGVAGPATLAHIVDTVLWFEGDKNLSMRILRSMKNRFGPTDEIGIFRMVERGLVGVDDPNAIFISENNKKAVGAMKTCIMQGTRPVIVEIQSLVTPTNSAYPKRIAQGIDSKKLEVVLAILSSRLNMKFYERDVFVSVVGGLSIKEPSADLALLLSLASAYKNKPIAFRSLAVGEVDLLGVIRETVFEQKRIDQVKRQGYKPLSSHTASTLRQAVKLLFK